MPSSNGVSKDVDDHECLRLVLRARTGGVALFPIDDRKAFGMVHRTSRPKTTWMQFRPLKGNSCRGKSLHLSLPYIDLLKFNGRWHWRSGYASGPTRACSKLCLGVVLVALLIVICPKVSNAQSQVDEYRLKAAFLFHFAQFVEWPPEALGNADNPFVICVVGEDPFHGDLEGTVEGKYIAARVVRIRHFKQFQEGQGCHMVFVDRKDEGTVPLRMLALRKTPVLTVGESDDFLQQGGIIRMFIEDRKLRFEINQGAAEIANLKVSSRLLLLAKTVVGGNRR